MATAVVVVHCNYTQQCNYLFNLNGALRVTHIYGLVQDYITFLRYITNFHFTRSIINKTFGNTRRRLLEAYDRIKSLFVLIDSSHSYSDLYGHQSFVNSLICDISALYLFYLKFHILSIRMTVDDVPHFNQTVSHWTHLFLERYNTSASLCGIFQSFVAHAYQNASIQDSRGQRLSTDTNVDAVKTSLLATVEPLSCGTDSGGVAITEPPEPIADSTRRMGFIVIRKYRGDTIYPLQRQRSLIDSHGTKCLYVVPQLDNPASPFVCISCRLTTCVQATACCTPYKIIVMEGLCPGLWPRSVGEPPPGLVLLRL
jgi:hypothetical protein